MHKPIRRRKLRLDMLLSPLVSRLMVNTLSCKCYCFRFFLFFVRFFLFFICSFLCFYWCINVMPKQLVHMLNHQFTFIVASVFSRSVFFSLLLLLLLLFFLFIFWLVGVFQVHFIFCGILI